MIRPAGPFLPPPADQTWPTADVLRASDMYAELCARYKAGLLTMLHSRTCAVPGARQHKALWSAIVEGGAMQATGCCMIGFGKFLPPAAPR